MEIMEKNKQRMVVSDDKETIRESSIVDFPHFVRDLLNEFCDPVTADELEKVLFTTIPQILKRNKPNITKRYVKQCEKQAKMY